MIPLLLLLALGGLMQAARSFTTDTSIAGTELTSVLTPAAPTSATRPSPAAK